MLEIKLGTTPPSKKTKTPKMDGGGWLKQAQYKQLIKQFKQVNEQIKHYWNNLGHSFAQQSFSWAWQRFFHIFVIFLFCERKERDSTKSEHVKHNIQVD